MNDYFTERQTQEWPLTLTEIERHTGTRPPANLDHYEWTTHWYEETRPGRGHRFSAVWTNGQHIVQVVMDIHGAPSIAIGDIDWTHTDTDDQCPCTHCTKDRQEETTTP